MSKPRAAAARAVVAVVALAAGALVALPADATVGSHVTPVVASVSVHELNRDETTVALIKGSGFEHGATVSIGPDVVSHVTSATSTQLTVRWSVAGTAQVGARSVTVTNPSGASGADRHAVHLGFAPIFTKWAVGEGATDWSTTLVRPTFTKVPGLSFSGSGVRVASATLNGAGQVVVAFTIGATAMAAWRTMDIRSGLSTWSVPHGLKVRPAPTITSMPSLGEGATAQTVLVRGTGFEQCGKAHTPTLSVSGPGVTVNWASDALGTLLYANLTVSQTAPLGRRAVTLVNCDSGGTVRSGSAFAVLGTPSVTSVPAIALGVSRTETIHGLNFTPDTVLVVPGTGVSITGVHYESPTKLRGTVTVSPSAPLGPRAVTASDTGGTSSTTSDNVLTVDPLPTEASATPAGIGANTTVAVTVHGTNLEPGAVVVALHGGVRDVHVAVGKVTVTSSTVLTASVSALGATSLSSDTLEVLNPDGGAVATLAFATNPGPHLSSLKPSASAAGALVATFGAPSGAPGGETYTAKACVKGAKHLTCVTRAGYVSGSTLAGLAPGVRYYVIIEAATVGGFFASASNLLGPALATVQLKAPVVSSTTPSTAKAGAVVVRFARPSNAPSTQRYAATACRNVAMTTGCVTKSGYASGAQLTGLVARDAYFVRVTALAASGYLAARSNVSLRVVATTQLAAPKVTRTAWSASSLVITYNRSANAATGQAYTAAACTNKAMTTGCVVHQSYRSGSPFSGVKAQGYYVRVTAIASSGFLAAPSAVVFAPHT